MSPPWSSSVAGNNSPALELWRDRVSSYLDGQEGIEILRSRVQPNSPWPEADNPMLGYLIARAMAIFEEEGPQTALAWVAVHAWFESALDTRAELIRHLGA